VPYGKLLTISLKYILTPVLLLCVGTIFSLFSYQKYLQHQSLTKTTINASNGVDSLERVTLGGVGQWILVRGMDKTSPVLLFLHGGPGSTMIPWHRAFHTELENYFTVVHWDQRGTGKSYASDIPPASMTVEQFIADTRELVELLRRRFNSPKIYLVGHSWGSELGIQVVSRYPELFYAYVGLGQVVDNLAGETISYKFAVAKAAEVGDEEAIRSLEELGPPPYNAEKSMRKWKLVAELGGAFHSTPDMAHFLKLGLSSPDYSVMDWWRFYRGMLFSQQQLQGQTNDTNFFADAPRLEVPVYFFVGKYDYVTPFELAERYYQMLDAPAGKELVWFDNSGHMVLYEEPEKFCDMLINKVLKETYPTISKPSGVE
jgi:pimeloyl-ACP methyl ester carboxylesterase